MSAGVAQLVAIGAQDEHIMGKPEISFFKATFKRHSNFSQAVEKQLIQGSVNSNSLSTVKFERGGDLLGYTYIAVDNGTQAQSFTDWRSIIASVEFYIGGQLIDTQDSTFSEKVAIDTLAQSVSKGTFGAHSGIGAHCYFYPLRFFFCESPQSAIPLVSLQYHEVEIRIRWGPNVPPYMNWEVYSNYYYLDNEERANVMRHSRDILITQVQKSVPSNELVQELTFNHPIKFLASSNTDAASALTSDQNRLKMTMNGLDMSNYKYAKPHFVDCSYYYHTNFATSTYSFLYAFSMTTSTLQPCGTLNFSRLDSARIYSEKQKIVDPIYAVNYNILRIENGLAGLLYAN